MPELDVQIISLIIHEEEKKKKIEKSNKYRENAVVQLEIPMYEERPQEKDEEEPKRGVIVIDI